MIDLEESIRNLEGLKNKLLDLGKSMDISDLEIKLQYLESQTTEEGFWSNSKKSAKILSEIKHLKSKCAKFKKLEKHVNEVLELAQLAKVENDLEMQIEIQKEEGILRKQVEKFELTTLLSGKYDVNNAIVTIHPGAGGTESQDWAEMLYRMYTRWATKNGYEVKELDYLEGEEAGIKNVTFEIIGENAYRIC